MQTKEIGTNGKGKGNGIEDENIHDDFPALKNMYSTSRQPVSWPRYSLCCSARWMQRWMREGEIWKEIAYAYGRNLGMAFQVG